MLFRSIRQADQVSKVVALYDSKSFVTANWLGEIRFFETETGRELTQVSSNPPKLAERLVATEKRLAELEPTLAPAEAAAKSAQERLAAAEAAWNKAKAAGEPAAKKLADAEARLAEQKKGLEYWQGMLAKAKAAADRQKAEKAVADQRTAIDFYAKESAAARPAAAPFLAAEADLAKARADLAAAQAKARDVAAETAAHRERVVFLKAAQFNVGVLTEQEKLAKLEQDIADLVAAKAENEAAKVTAAARIESSKKTVARNEEQLPGLQSALEGLKAELASLDKSLSPFRIGEAEAMGKIEAQQKLIDAQSEAIVRLGQDRDAAVALAAAAVADYRAKFTTPLRARLDAATAKVDAVKKSVDEAKAVAAKAKAALAAAAAESKAKALRSVQAAEAAAKAAAAVTAAEQAYADARGFKAIFSFSYFARKKQTEQQLADAKAAVLAARAAQGEAEQALVAAKSVEQGKASASAAADAAVAAAEKNLAPAGAEVAAITKERSARIAEREKLAVPGAVAEKAYAAQLPALQAALQKAKDGLPALEKGLAEVRARLAEAAKPVEALRAKVEAAAKEVELTKHERANAEKALLAAQKDIPQRDKNLEEIAKTYAELTPQVEPMKAKVKAAQDQYLAMLPKHEAGKKN